jgi:hypothetical protein
MIFVPDDDSVESKGVKELKSIIKTQQNIIDKLAERLKQMS